MSFQSVHDLLTPPGVVRKQKFWDWFSGDSLKSYWTFANESGSGGSGAMQDAVNGGYQITTDTSSNDYSGISFSNIANHYSATASSFIAVANRDSTLSRYWAGLMETKNGVGDYYICDNVSANTFYILKTSDGGTNTDTNTSVAVDTTVRKSQGISNNSSIALWLDDVLEAINTANLPTTALQPNYVVMTNTTAAKTGSIRYFEAYNT